jgi:branched-chain amino acid transport system ATP-binding protein
VSVSLTATTTDVVLEAAGVFAGYRGVPVTRDINLTVSRGEVVVLLGANGSGKTTTLLTLAGELPCIRGQVFWLGTPTRAPLHRRARQGLRFITEERSIFRGLTTRDNLRLGGGSIEKALTLFPELVPLLKRPAGLLSGGEQQILTVARALSADPVLMIADELSLGLAPLVSARLAAAIRDAARDFGVGVLLVEQQLRQALSISDRGYVLRRGEIVLSGSSDELRRRRAEIEDTYLSVAVADVST